MFIPAVSVYFFLLARTSYGLPYDCSVGESAIAPRGVSCLPNFRNTVFNIGAPKHSGWRPGSNLGKPAGQWRIRLEYEHVLSDDVLLTDNTDLVGFTQDIIPNAPTYNLGSGPAPSSPEIDAAQIKIYMDPSKVAEALTLITSDNPPADWLTQFNDACNQYMNQIPIISAYIYKTSPDEAIATIEALHTTWPNQKIWITELAPSSDPAQGCMLDEQGVIGWMNDVLPWIVALGYVERVFWNSGEAGKIYPDNPGFCNPSLTNEDGSPTALLQAYGATCS
ncbi:hypothetical protein MMC30_006073 [Trapelia coarctata]|nr:hypothetical protein [Trapelia coarctata]